MAHPPVDLLNHLIGRWDLTGQMGETPLHQAVEARWVLGGLFVEMHCRSVLPEPEGQQPYEAIYLIGYNATHDRYVLNLFDTFGVALPPVPGVGQCAGDTIPFVFPYEGGPFTYRFAWDAASLSWAFEQVQEVDGQAHPFATKRMVRASGD